MGPVNAVHATTAAAAAREAHLADAGRRIDTGGGTAERAWQRSVSLKRVAPVDIAQLVPPGARAVILAPHPDDEMLGCGALMALLARLGREILLVAVTDGEHSHGTLRESGAIVPSQPYWSPHRLSQVRPTETARALSILGLDGVPVMRARLPDGAVAQHRGQLDALLQTTLRATDIVFASWRQDGHPDHEAVGEAAAAQTRSIGCRLVEVPVWAWNWAAPDDPRFAWHRARKLMLDDEVQELKQRALACYRSQMEADPANGALPVVPPGVVAYFRRPYEVFFV